jgi:hypothetical protein
MLQSGALASAALSIPFAFTKYPARLKFSAFVALSPTKQVKLKPADKPLSFALLVTGPLTGYSRRSYKHCNKRNKTILMIDEIFLPMWKLALEK